MFKKFKFTLTVLLSVLLLTSCLSIFSGGCAGCGGCRFPWPITSEEGNSAGGSSAATTSGTLTTSEEVYDVAIYAGNVPTLDEESTWPLPYYTRYEYDFIDTTEALVEDDEFDFYYFTNGFKLASIEAENRIAHDRNVYCYHANNNTYFNDSDEPADGWVTTPDADKTIYETKSESYLRNTAKSGWYLFKQYYLEYKELTDDQAILQLAGNIMREYDYPDARYFFKFYKRGIEYNLEAEIKWTEDDVRNFYSGKISLEFTSGLPAAVTVAMKHEIGDEEISEKTRYTFTYDADRPAYNGPFAPGP